MAASHCFGGQINCPRRRRTPPRPLSSKVEVDQSIRGGQSDFIPAAFQSSVSCPRGASSLRPTSTGVGTFLLPALSHSVSQTALGTSGHRLRVSDCSGGQASCPLRIRHRSTYTFLILSCIINKYQTNQFSGDVLLHG